MNMSDYEQYYQKGGTYVLPIEIFNELFGEMESWKKQSNQLQFNWNSLRGYTKAHIEIIENKLSLIGTCNPIMATKELQIYQQYLDKMNELEGNDKE